MELRLRRVAWVAALAAACAPADDSDAQAFDYPDAHYRLAGVAREGGDSLLLRGSTALALSGDLVAVLHQDAGRVLVIDLARRTYRLLGQPGGGPADVPPAGAQPARVALSANGGLAILDPAAQTVRVWEASGAVGWSRRLSDDSGRIGDFRNAAVGFWWAGLGLDTAGRVYLPVGAWTGDSVIVRILRAGALPEDTAWSSPLTADGPFRLEVSGGLTGNQMLRRAFVKQRGMVQWDVDPAGLLFRARGDSLWLDTLHVGGPAGRWFAGSQVANVEVPESLVAQAVQGILVRGRPIVPADLMPVRFAVLRQLFVTPRSVWMGLGFGPGGNQFDVLDRDTRAARRVTLGLFPAAVSDRWAVFWVAGPDGALWLDLVRLDRPGPGPAEPALLELRAQ